MTDSSKIFDLKSRFVLQHNSLNAICRPVKHKPSLPPQYEFVYDLPETIPFSLRFSLPKRRSCALEEKLFAPRGDTLFDPLGAGVVLVLERRLDPQSGDRRGFFVLAERDEIQMTDRA